MLLTLIPYRAASCSRVIQPGGKGRRGVFKVVGIGELRISDNKNPASETGAGYGASSAPGLWQRAVYGLKIGSAPTGAELQLFFYRIQRLCQITGKMQAPCSIVESYT
jgi:hypothetical protein